jgi:hypothetical protein
MSLVQESSANGFHDRIICTSYGNTTGMTQIGSLITPQCFKVPKRDFSVLTDLGKYSIEIEIQKHP